MIKYEMDKDRRSALDWYSIVLFRGCVSRESSCRKSMTRVKCDVIGAKSTDNGLRVDTW